MLRALLWRSLGVLAVVASFASARWLAEGGLGRALRGPASTAVRRASPVAPGASVHAGARPRARSSDPVARALSSALVTVELLGGSILSLAVGLVATRSCARRKRDYVRFEVRPYRTDRAGAQALVTMFAALHKRLLRPWPARLLAGQPSISLEVHTDSVGGRASAAWLAVAAPRKTQKMIQAALRAAYPNCALHERPRAVGPTLVVLRLKKGSEFVKRAKTLDRFEQERDPPVNRLLNVMGACRGPALVQLTLTPAPRLAERLARHAYKRDEARSSPRRQGRDRRPTERSMVELAELRGGLELQHSSLFFVDLRVAAPDRETCRTLASELRAQSAENPLVERWTRGRTATYRHRLSSGQGNPAPSLRTSLFAPAELAAMWQLPSVDYASVPVARDSLPVAPASPAILRPHDGRGTLRDELGPVSIHVELRKQNTAVTGTVDQGKSSFLVATVAEDLTRERCAVIVLDPKGDAADAAISLVPDDRVCTLLDLAHPTCGFNPLADDAPADVIADYVVGALKNLFTDVEIRASSDRYLRNAIIAVLADERSSTLWDAARLLSVGEEGYAYRRRVAARVRSLPELKEISTFFTSELSAQLADARSPTTSKLDAPVNKLARLLNSPSIKRVLLNESLRVDLDQVIAGSEVLVVKGALGAMGAGNTSVLMQLLVGMLDAALARQQDLVPPAERVAVALKVDEAPLVLNRGFAETMALKRSAGLETVASWQTDAQWTELEIRDQLDALFAHRVHFATASARDARRSVELTMAEFSDTVRPGIANLSALGRPDARLHLPKHHAIVSWTTPEGRQAPFVAQTIPLRVDEQRVRAQASRQHERGGRPLTDLTQPRWDRPVEPLPPGPPLAPSPERAIVAGTAVPCAPPVRRRVAPADRDPKPAEEGTRASPDSAGARCPADPAGTRRPPAPAESYRELVELDRAQSVRWAHMEGRLSRGSVDRPARAGVGLHGGVGGSRGATS